MKASELKIRDEVWLLRRERKITLLTVTRRSGDYVYLKNSAKPDAVYRVKQDNELPSPITEIVNEQSWRSTQRNIHRQNYNKMVYSSKADAEKIIRGSAVAVQLRQIVTDMTNNDTLRGIGINSDRFDIDINKIANLKAAIDDVLEAINANRR